MFSLALMLNPSASESRGSVADGLNLADAAASTPVDKEQRDGALRYVRVQCRTENLDLGRPLDEIRVAQLAQMTRWAR
jgi:hypothetical protein